ncbi:hypothetical protein [Rossellomorea aquimaris]|uniref:Uncharacterized protein n=1 Tax=Rossellomorea aquimaris TaxID=189382 RepID=A0A366EWB7_9BACI|nr:hypothetical protein [Rossellomorea aquimaris]RBP06216.1 hypothetical protein DET59_103348 [Rossellomorea aquimaris]
MKKSWIAVVLLVVAVVGGGTYLWVKENPPMEIGMIGQNEDGTSVLVEVTNHGFREAKVVRVTVNNNDAPEKVKMQVSNLLKGYVIIDDIGDQLPIEVSLQNLEDVSIKAGPTNSEQLESLDAGTATKDDTLYAVHVFHDEAVSRVMVEYQYFGMTFHETVEVPF